MRRLQRECWSLSLFDTEIVAIRWQHQAACYPGRGGCAAAVFPLTTSDVTFLLSVVATFVFVGLC